MVADVVAMQLNLSARSLWGGAAVVLKQIDPSARYLETTKPVQDGVPSMKAI